MSVAYKPKDFANENEVRWCPGCGDYAILSAIQKALPEIGLPPEKHVFVSGIGCAGRLPYYMNTYGLHTIHGRALAVATGLALTRDDLSIWVITGDGDALSIGGNHLIHTLRRNLNINILLINNEVYGLTKGQFSPTSKIGQRTKTSPDGVHTNPVNPLSLALSVGASFVARAVDKDPKFIAEILQKAHAHQGVSFVEIYQDCHIFNEGAFDKFSLKANRSANTLILEENKPMNFGPDNEYYLSLKNEKIATSTKSAQALLHNPHDKMQALALAELSYPDFPVPLGVYYQESRDSLGVSKTTFAKDEELDMLFRMGAMVEV